MMELKDLSGAQTAILRALYDRGSCVRSILVQELQDRIPNGTISSCLNRLEAMGLIEKPEIAGGEWMINLQGATIFARHPGAAPSESAAVRTMLAVSTEPEFVPEPEALTPEHAALPPDPEVLTPERAALPPDPALRVAEALAEVKARLNGGWTLPAETIRVYREVVSCLPQPLQEALEPLTVRIS